MEINDGKAIQMLKDEFNAFCDRCAVKWIANEYEATEQQRAEAIERWRKIRDRGLELIEGMK